MDRSSNAADRPTEANLAAPPANRRQGLRQLLGWTLLAWWQQALAAGRPAGDAAPAPQTTPGAPGASPAPLNDWAALQPDTWDPWQPLHALGWPGPVKRPAWDDTDPAHAAGARALRRHWDAAPPARRAQDKPVRLVGFVLPLARDAATGAAQALLVPRFGAGVYTPAPPANQVVRLRWAPHAAGLAGGDTHSDANDWAMAAVSAQGLLRAWPSDSPLGRSAWLIEPVQLARYRPAA